MINRIAEYYKKNGSYFFIKQCIKKILRCEQRNYKRYVKQTRITSIQIQEQKNRKFSFMPQISIVVPLYKTPEIFLEDLIESVRSQTYQKWELCLSDGSGLPSPLHEQLHKWSEMDSRIKVYESPVAMHISENTNQALKLCTGDYIVFMDHDDILEPDALFCCIEYLNGKPETELLYTDEDKVSANGNRFFQPHFKPDYNEDLLRSMNYICHMVMVKRSLLQEVGEIREEYDGAQDYDFLLRCVEKTHRIGHIPRVLYHWRVHENSTAKEAGKKEYADGAGCRALQNYYDRKKIAAKVFTTENAGIYRTEYSVEKCDKVSILIPNKDHVEDLERCLYSVKEKAGYDNYEILILENNSEEKETFSFYESITRKEENIRVLYWKEGFNYAAINNWGAQFADGRYLLFLNNDIEWISDGFLREMLSVTQRKEVGITGNLLYYPDGLVQHAGVIIGYSGIAGHAFIGQPSGVPGYFSRIICTQDYSAVTAASMMVEKEVFDAVNGFDERYEVAFNDIDFCLRVRETGKLIVYDPYAKAYHYESKSRGSDESIENRQRFEREKELFKTTWKEYLASGDIYYNKNLTLERPDFEIKKEA